MKNQIFNLLVATSLLVSTTWLFAAPPVTNPRVIPSHYIVVFKKNVDTNQVTDNLKGRFNSIAVSHRYHHAIRGFAANIPEQLISKIAADPNVDYIEPDVVVSINAQTLPTGINRINADLDTTANIDNIDDRIDVDIAIIDTGIDLDHPDLNVFNFSYCQDVKPGPQIIWSCVDNDPLANDVNTHGTHVAGIAAALDNNSGVVGVAPGARLWAIKALEDDGNGAGSQIIAAVDYVAQHADEIEVVNMSLTGYGEFQALDDAITGVVSAGVVFTLAAGNATGGNPPQDVSLVFPAGHPDAITVSAFEDYDGIAGGLSGNAGDDTFANFSNYGADVDIMAPGVNIRSTMPGGGLGNKSGTSMASPHVAGAAALYISNNPGASPANVKSALLITIDSTPCANNPNGICGAPEDPDGIQEPLLLLSCDDTDLDGFCDEVDNCPVNANPNQTDIDNDQIGDVCDLDNDNDGIENTLDNCPLDPNLDQLDTDGDGFGDVCDADDDGDSVDDLVDNCPVDSNTNQLNTDNDTFGDACDTDDDNDSFDDFIDNCPLIPNSSQLDTDNDGIGNACDDDDDNDGLSDSFELSIGINPLLNDSDGDTISDYDEIAYDGDASSFNPATDLNPLSTDTDNDLLSDNNDPIPLSFNYNDGDLAPIGAPDGIIDTADYAVAVRLILDELTVSDLELSHGDLYPPGAPDGIINTADLILIKQLIN